MGNAISNGKLISPLSIDATIKDASLPLRFMLDQKKLIAQKNQIPKDLDHQIAQLVKELKVDPKLLQQFQNTSAVFKSLILSEYKQIIGKNILDRIPDDEIGYFSEKLANPTLQDLEQMRRYLKQTQTNKQDQQLELFNKVINQLIENLFKFHQQNQQLLDKKKPPCYLQQIEILNILEILVKHEKIQQTILKIPDSMDIILKNLHPVHVEMTTTVLEIASHLCWNTDEGYNWVLRSLNKLYEDNEIQFFITTLQKSRNVVMIATICVFVITLIESPTQEEERKRMKQLFMNSGIVQLYKSLQMKIEEFEFKAEELKFEIVMHQLIEFNRQKHQPINDPNYIEEIKLPMLYQRDSRKCFDFTEFANSVKIIEDQIDIFLENTKDNQNVNQMEQKKPEAKPHLKHLKSNFLTPQYLNLVQEEIGKANLTNLQRAVENIKYESKIRGSQIVTDFAEGISKYIDKLNQPSNTSENDVTANNQNSDILKQQIEDLHEKIASLENEIKDMNTKKQSNESFIDTLQRKIGELEKKQKTDSSNFTQLNEQLASKNKDYRALQQQHEAQLKSIQQLENEVASLKEKLQIVSLAKAQKMELEVPPQRLSFRPENDDQKQQIDQLKQEVSQQNQKLLNQETEIKKQQQQIKELNDNLFTKELQITEKNKECRQLQADNENLIKKKYAKKLQLQQLKEKIQSVSYVKQQATKIQNELKTIEQYHEELIRLNGIIEDQAFVLEQQKLQQKKFEDLKQDQKNNEAKLQQLEQENQQLQTQFQHLIDQIQKLTSEKENLIKQVQTISQNNTSSSQAAVQNIPLPPKSAPPPPPPPPPPLPPGAKFGGAPPPPPPPPPSGAPPPPPPPPPPPGGKIGGPPPPPPPPPPPGGKIGGPPPPPPPPPPPGGKVGGPPPPPPPPPPGAKAGGPPPPPPPPGARPPGPPPPPGPRPPGGPDPQFGQVVGKQKHKPNVQLKQVPWTIIKPEQIKNTVWDSIDDTKVNIDFSSIESMFAVKPSGQASNTQGQSQPQKPVKISMLGPERVKNLEILLGKLKMSNQLIVESLYSLDEAVLKPNIVESLVAAMPNDTEVGLWQDPDQSNLALPDLFCINISSVKGYDFRLLALKFKSNFKELADDLLQKIQCFQKLILKTKNDENTKIVMEYALAAGNYMNGQSARGGAYGFKFDMLEKLADIKTTDNKSSLLMFIIQRAEDDKKKEIVSIDECLDDIELAAKTPLTQLTADLNEMKKNCKVVEKAIKSKVPPPINDHVELKLQDFFDQTSNQLAVFETQLKQLDVAYDDLANFYAENKVAFDKFFEKYFKFKAVLRQAKQNINKQKLLEQKELEKKKKIEQQQLQQQQKQQQLQQLQQKQEQSVNQETQHKEDAKEPQQQSVISQKKPDDNSLSALKRLDKAQILSEVAKRRESKKTSIQQIAQLLVKQQQQQNSGDKNQQQ